MTDRVPIAPIAEQFPPRTERVTISTDSVAPGDRFEWWRNEFSALHKVEIAPNNRKTFDANGEHWLLGQILIGRYRTPSRRVVRTPLDIKRSDFDHWMLRMATKGILVCRGPSGAFRAFPGQIVLSSFAESYSDDYGPGEWIAAMIPRNAIPTFGISPSPRAPGILRGPSAALLGDFLLSLTEHLRNADPSGLPAIAEVTRAMIVASLVGDAVPTTQNPAERSVVMRERIDRMIRHNLASARLNPERICALAGISRSTLYRLFEDRGGVAAYVQALRLKRVYAELSNPQLEFDTIASLAEGQGMHNAAAFNRAFRRHFGCTPRDVRAAALSNDPAALGHAATSTQSFANLLRSQ